MTTQLVAYVNGVHTVINYFDTKKEGLLALAGSEEGTILEHASKKEAQKHGCFLIATKKVWRVKQGDKVLVHEFQSKQEAKKFISDFAYVAKKGKQNVSRTDGVWVINGHTYAVV